MKTPDLPTTEDRGHPSPRPRFPARSAERTLAALHAKSRCRLIEPRNQEGRRGTVRMSGRFALYVDRPPQPQSVRSRGSCTSGKWHLRLSFSQSPSPLFAMRKTGAPPPRRPHSQDREDRGRTEGHRHRFRNRHDNLFLLEASKIIPNFLLSGQVEE